jgi:bifunctional DNA-binding transcriptional regulator/antitoxin component of YhaV-PrlF toxin-antitoxin module
MQAEKVDFEQVTAGLKTKSDKIRALSRHGVPTAEIARYLDIRYQHARNVLKEAGLHKVANAAPAQQTMTPKPYAWVDLDKGGRLAIPPELLTAAGLEPGLAVHVRLTDDGIEVLSQRAALRRAQAIARRYIPEGSPSMVDELIAERRREAEREDRGE